MFRAMSAAILIGSAIAAAPAQEVVLRNDSFENNSGFNVCPCFAPGEEAAVWLTCPCDGTIVGFQIYWRSFFGGDDPRIEESIKVYESSDNFPTPGPLIDELLAPVLTDGFLNEYRFVDDMQTIPISIPISAGETIVVSLKFFNSNANDFFAGTTGSDDDGCQPGRNTLKLAGGANPWQDACTFQGGISGDWVIRAIVECEGGDPQGACCLPDGGCAEGLTAVECASMSGFWNGAGSLCSDAPCVGACFIPATEACVPDFTKVTCDAVGGNWQGPGTTDCSDCVADCDGSGVLNFDDIDCFVEGFLMSNLSAADCDGSGSLNLDDIDCFATAFLAGCP